MLSRNFFQDVKRYWGYWGYWNRKKEFFRTLISRLTLEQREIVCRSKMRYSSRIIPSRVNFATNGIDSPLHLISQLIWASIFVWYFHLKMIALDLLAFSRRRLRSSQSGLSSRPDSSSDDNRDGFSPARKSVVSSAKKYYLSDFKWSEFIFKTWIEITVYLFYYVSFSNEAEKCLRVKQGAKVPFQYGTFGLQGSQYL